MKLCQTCTEFNCNKSGTKSISKYCGDPNYKIQCMVFSNSRAKAEQQLERIIKNQPVSILKSQYTLEYETNEENWKWVPLNEKFIKGHRPIKAYIDLNVSLKDYNDLIEPVLVNVIDNGVEIFN